MVRGRLLQNVITGKDDAVQSARQLGADRRISMWQSDREVGMVILKLPPIPKIDHEVPWIKSGFQEEEQSKAKIRKEEEQEQIPSDTEDRS